MAKNGDTGLFQLNNGNWAYRIIIERKGQKKTDTTCRQDEQGNPFKTKKQAKEARENKLFELKQPKEPVIKDVKLSEVYNKYIKEGTRGKAPATIKKQSSMWEKHVEKNFGDRYMSQITLSDLQNYLQKLYSHGDDLDTHDGGYTYAYVEGFLKFFYLLFGEAYRAEFIDPLRYTRMFIDKGSRLTMPPMTQEDAINEDNVQVFTERELRKINHVMERGNCHTAFMLGYHLGLRIGECFALMWKDINWEAGTITINKQMQYEDGCFCLGPVKTLRSVRTIEMGKALNNYLCNAFVKQSNQRLALKDGYRDTELVLDKTKSGKIVKIFGGDFINRKENGKLLNINSIKYWSRTIKEETEIDFHYHSLRKTHATMMANLNTPVLELMNRLGHKKYETTMAYYINSNQLSKDTLKENLDRLDFIREDMHSYDVLLELLDVFDEQEEVLRQTPQWVGEDMTGRLKINVGSV